MRARRESDAAVDDPANRLRLGGTGLAASAARRDEALWEGGGISSSTTSSSSIMDIDRAAVINETKGVCGLFRVARSDCLCLEACGVCIAGVPGATGSDMGCAELKPALELGPLVVTLAPTGFFGVLGTAVDASFSLPSRSRSMPEGNPDK